MKAHIVPALILTMLSTRLVSADGTNEYSGPTNTVITATNETLELKGFMRRTHVVSRPDQHTIDRIKLIRLKMKPSSGPRPDKAGPQSQEEAAEYLARNVAMACPPGAGLEYEGCFYFSGGTSTKVGTSFLSGFAIKRGDTAILSWDRSP